MYDIISYPLSCCRGYGNLSTRGIAISRAAEGQAWYCDAKQTNGSEFIPCSNDVCLILKCFRSFKTSAIAFIWPKSCKLSVTRSHRSHRDCHCDVIIDVPFSLYLTLMASNVSIGFRNGFRRRDISSVYLWCWWQGAKIKRLNSMRKLWLKA